ncbi:hypothetical protein FQZ97_880000 [compost metagenome]
MYTSPQPAQSRGCGQSSRFCPRPISLSPEHVERAVENVCVDCSRAVLASARSDCSLSIQKLPESRVRQGLQADLKFPVNCPHRLWSELQTSCGKAVAGSLQATADAACMVLIVFCPFTGVAGALWVIAGCNAHLRLVRQRFARRLSPITVEAAVRCLSSDCAQLSVSHAIRGLYGTGEFLLHSLRTVPESC